MGYDNDLSFEYNNPTKIIFGENCTRDIRLEIEGLGCSKALIVTDKGVVEAGLTGQIEEILGDSCVGIYDRIVQDSDFALINEGAAYAVEKGADVLVSVGGGSVIDTAKGMAIVMKEGGELKDYAGMQVLSRPQIPHVVVPTTAGTGSEVTWAAVIKNRELNTKELFCSYYIIPNIAFIDPTMTAKLPPQLTASTGMDAFTHAVEAIHALQSQPITDAMALHAISLSTEFLPRCVEQGDDLVARGQQQLAAVMAGIAFGNAQLGLVHAMAHSVGALFEVPHGIANSIILPHVMRFNLEECADRYALIAEAMGINTSELSDMEAGKAAAEAVAALTKKIGLPQTLSEVDVPEEGLTEAAELSLSDGSIVYNPRMIMDADEVLEVYRAAF